MPEQEKKKRLCLRCGSNEKLKDKEYPDDASACEAGHDIDLEAYLFGREAEREKKPEPKKRKGLLDNLRVKK